jgi:putative FmdB family regulatory protein
MPTYDYVCDACGHRFELFQSITASPEKTCPKCRKRKLRRLIGIGAAVLVGGGSSSRGGDESESSSSSSSSSSSGSDSTDSKKIETTAKSDDSSSSKTDKPDKVEKKISGSTSTPTHEAREGRGVGNLVDAVRRQRRESGKSDGGKAAVKKKPGTSKKASTSGKTPASKKSGGRSSKR